MQELAQTLKCARLVLCPATEGWLLQGHRPATPACSAYQSSPAVTSSLLCWVSSAAGVPCCVCGEEPRNWLPFARLLLHTGEQHFFGRRGLRQLARRYGERM